MGSKSEYFKKINDICNLIDDPVEREHLKTQLLKINEDNVLIEERSFNATGRPSLEPDELWPAALSDDDHPSH